MFLIMLTSKFGEWIKIQRKKNGWSQAELSKITRIPQTTLSGWELGRVKNFNVDERLALLARAFSLRMCELPFELLYDKDGQGNKDLIN